jgi:PAS domain S-box-containing protein
LVLGGIGALRLAEHYDFARTYCYVLAVAVIAGIATLIALEGGWLEGLAERWRRVPGVDALRHNLGLLRNRRGGWLGLVIGSFAFQLVSIGVIFLLFGALSVNATPSQCALIAAVVGLAAALPISINGVGVMEGALVAAAVAMKLDYESALLVAFARRVLAVCAAVPCGALWIVEARSLELAQNRTGFLGLLQTFWREGFRGLLQAVPEPPPVMPRVLEEPDVPLAARAARDEPHWLHPQLLEFTHDAIIIWEMDGQGIVYWNRAAEQLYGFNRAEAHSRTTHELLQTELADGVSHLEATLARYGIWVGELRHTTREGRHVYVDARLALLSQQNGKWLVLEVNRDITDRKAAEAARSAVERQLAELHVLRDGSH